MNETHHIVYCKHKHMLENGAPPDKVRFLYRLLTESWFNS